jgi:hypothetical protein
MDQASEALFLGTGWAFPPAFSAQDRSPLMVSDEEDIRQSLRILFSTGQGERVMLPTWGCGLKSRVFDPMDATLATEITDLVQRAVLFFESRITLNEVTVSVTDPSAGLVSIYLSWTTRTTNTRSNLVFPFYLLENAEAPNGNA